MLHSPTGADVHQEHLAAVVECSDDAILSKDLNGILTSWNRGAERMYGYTAEEAIGRPVSMLFPDDRADDLSKIMERLRHGGRVDHYETVRLAKDGRPIDVSLTVSPITDRAGEIVGASTIARDITERKRTERALQESERQLCAIFEAATVGIAEADVTTRRFLRVNPALCAITGYSAPELLQMTVDELNHPEDREPDRQRYRLFQQKTGDYRHVEKRYVRKDGEIVWVCVNGTIVRDGEGCPLWATALVEAVTDIKRAEAALRESEQKLREVNASLAQRVAERTAEAEQRAEQLARLSRELIEAEERERRRLARRLHDDLQQLLFAVTMRLATIPKVGKAGEARDAARELLDQAIEESRSLTSELSPRSLRVANLVPSLQWLSEWAQTKYGLKVRFKADGLCPIQDEPLRVLLYQAVRELLLNVVKHANVDEMHITLQSDDGKVCLQVEDSGAGFDPEAARAKADASGYGLFSWEERLEFLGCRVDIDSAPGRGTRVRVTVPL